MRWFFSFGIPMKVGRSPIGNQTDNSLPTVAQIEGETDAWAGYVAKQLAKSTAVNLGVMDDNAS